MSNPYTVLGLLADSDDETIRRRYLELEKQYSPEHAPEKFAAIRAAYEKLRDLDTGCATACSSGKQELEAIIEEVACRAPSPPPITLAALPEPGAQSLEHGTDRWRANEFRTWLLEFGARQRSCRAPPAARRLPTCIRCSVNLSPCGMT